MQFIKKILKTVLPVAAPMSKPQKVRKLKLWKENSLQYMVNNKAQKVYLINLNFKGHYRSLI